MAEITEKDAPENTPPIRYGIVEISNARAGDIVTEKGVLLDYDTREEAEAKLKQVGSDYTIVEHREQTPPESLTTQEFQDAGKAGTLPIEDRTDKNEDTTTTP